MRPASDPLTVGVLVGSDVTLSRPPPPPPPPPIEPEDPEPPPPPFWPDDPFEFVPLVRPPAPFEPPPDPDEEPPSDDEAPSEDELPLEYEPPLDPPSITTIDVLVEDSILVVVLENSVNQVPLWVEYQVVAKVVADV